MRITTEAPLVGRGAELVLIADFLERAADPPRALVLEGEAGIGKTTLWTAGVEQARAVGHRVLEARPTASERELSFAGLGDLLAGTEHEIGLLPAPQQRALRIVLVLEEAAGAPLDQRAVAASVLGLLRGLAEDGPVLVAVDDAHWLDPPSADALRFALRRLDEEPVRALLAVRDERVARALDGAERLRVGPLPLPALDRLVRERLGARLLRPVLLQLERASGGNPFYALEIADALVRSGSRPEPGEPLPVPASLHELVADRLAQLTPRAREAALVVAALAQPVTRVVEEVTTEGPVALAEAVSANVLERDGESLRFTHPLLASTLYERSSVEERREMHRRLALAVEDPEERARYLAEAADGPDEELAQVVEAAAASTAARGAPDAAAKLAMRAFELTPLDRPTDAHRRHLAGARHTLAAGDPLRAELLLERQLRLSTPGRERAEVELELGKARLATQGSSAARECLERALALNPLDAAEDAELRTELLITLADMHAREQLTSSTASEQAVALAESIGNPDLLARALGIHGIKLVILDRQPPAEYWERALAIEARAGELRYLGPTHAFIFAAYCNGDLRAAEEGQQRLASSMRRRGDPMLPFELIGMSETARVTGDWEAAANLAEEAHDLVVQTGRESDEAECLLAMARIALPCGELEHARRLSEEALARARELPSSEVHGLQIEATAKAVFAQIAEISGRHAEAHEWSTQVVDAAGRLGPLFDHFLAEALAGDLESILALGELEEAAGRLASVLEIAEAAHIPTLDGIAARAEGLHAAAGGDVRVALGRLERAVEIFETLPSPWPFQLGRTLLALGSVQRRARQKAGARATLERALEIFERLGARLWAEKARDELGRIGGRPVRSSALTPTEQRIAELVAAGGSNAQVARELFVSPKTVEWNLSKIYKKLRVRTRAELAAKLAKASPATR